MREKSAATIPVRPCEARTLRPSRSSALMIFGREDRLELIGIHVLVPQIAGHVFVFPK
jgi:hypothetical protein